jgi:hypothetical protein
MINILSIRCSLAFAPYLAESAAEFLTGGAITSQVVRQGGNGLILRSDGDFVLRHQHRQSSLGREDVRHYRATINFRAEFHDVYRMQDEIVMVNIGNEVLLSHPQSELWLGSETITALRTAFNSDSATARGFLWSAGMVEGLDRRRAIVDKRSAQRAMGTALRWLEWA